MEYSFYDSEDELGFGVDAEIVADLDYTCQSACAAGLEDPGYDAECVIHGWSGVWVQTTDNGISSWEDLSSEKQDQLNHWISVRSDSNEVHDFCFEWESSRFED